MSLVLEPLADMVGVGCGFLQNGVRSNHLARNEVLADAEVLKRALGLSAPKPIGWDFDFAERVFLYSNVCIIQNVFLLNKFSQIIVPASLRTETNRSLWIRYRLRFRRRCRPPAPTVVATHR